MAIIKSTSYNIYIEDKTFKGLTTFLSKNSYSKYVIICNEHTFTHCLPNLLFNCSVLNDAEIIELESGEVHKTLDTCLQVWGALTDMGADKKSLVINLGGGVISDLGGFVSSTYKRGVDFINIPTTLLSMVDASVGGKTGVDFEGIKNHIGTIHEPKGVFVNLDFLKTLSDRHIKNGYAEVIKIALIADVDFWKLLEKKNTISDFCNEIIITRAIELKNSIVKKDLFETGIRKSLNFGHSIGHALESALIKQNKDILHGEAVAYGMIAEANIAYNLKKLTKKEVADISKYIKSIFTAISINKATQTLVQSYIVHDKKNNGDTLCFALPNHIGSYELCCTITLADVSQALQ